MKGDRVLSWFATLCLGLLIALPAALTACGDDETTARPDTGGDVVDDLADMVEDPDADVEPDLPINECLDSAPIGAALGGADSACHTCACEECSIETLSCLGEAGCASIVQCAGEEDCSGLDCYGTAADPGPCREVIDAAGGLAGASGTTALAFSTCLGTNSCPCGGEPPEDVGPDVADVPPDVVDDAAGDVSTDVSTDVGGDVEGDVSGDGGDS